MASPISERARLPGRRASPPHPPLASPFLALLPCLSLLTLPCLPLLTFFWALPSAQRLVGGSCGGVGQPRALGGELSAHDGARRALGRARVVRRRAQPRTAPTADSVAWRRAEGQRDDVCHVGPSRSRKRPAGGRGGARARRARRGGLEQDQIRAVTLQAYQ